MKIRFLLICIFVLFAFFVSTDKQTFAQTRNLTISNLKGDYNGCGCAFQSLVETRKPRSRKIIFWSEDDKTAIVNINRTDTTFKLTRKGLRPKAWKVGYRFSDVYTSGGITLKIDYMVTGVCRRGDESCEATSFDATITVVRGKQRKILKTKGDCGC